MAQAPTLSRSQVEEIVRQVVTRAARRRPHRRARARRPRLGAPHAPVPGGPRPAVRPRLRADRRPAALPAGQLRGEGDGDAHRAAQPADLEPADPRAAALAVADRAGLHGRGEPRATTTCRSASPATSTARRARYVMGPHGRRRAEAGRHPRRDARPHEPAPRRRTTACSQGDLMKLRVGGDAAVDVQARARADRAELAARRAHGHGRGERVRPALATEIELFK